jgi:hypothetical protein
MQLHQLSSKIQVRFNQFGGNYVFGFDRPLQQFVRQMVIGSLKSGKVQLNALGEVLRENISLQKTTKR